MTLFLFEWCFLKSYHLTQRSPTRHGTGIFKVEAFLSDFLTVSHHQEQLRSELWAIKFVTNNHFREKCPYPGQETEPKTEFQEKLVRVHSSTLVVFEVEFRAHFGGRKTTGSLKIMKRMLNYNLEKPKGWQEEKEELERLQGWCCQTWVRKSQIFQLTAGGNTNCYNHYGNQWKFLK